MVDGIIGTFVEKVEDKVGDIIILYKDYECELVHGTIRTAGFEGDVTLKFNNGVTFRVHVMLKTNYSVYGKPFWQYPLTFHDIKTLDGKQAASCAESEILDIMGVVPWKPVKMAKPWSTLSIGDIVETKDGKLGKLWLVTGTRKDVIHLWGEKGSGMFTADDIKVIHARTRVWDKYTHIEGKDAWECTKFGVNVEMHNGRVQAFEIGTSRKLYDEGYGVKRDTMIRKTKFAEIVAKWSELLIPPPPVVKRPRRRRWG